MSERKTDTTTLENLKVGQACHVQCIELEGTMRRRLQDLGMIDGTRVECRQKSPGKGPIAYLVRSTVYALRREDARRIIVVSD